MVDAIVSSLVDQLFSMAVQEAKEQVRLVKGVGKEVKKLENNFRTIRAVLRDAEQRQVKEESVRDWLDQLKEESYDMEDVLDEWNYARLKLKIEGVDENALVPNKKVCSFLFSSCFCVKQVSLRQDIAGKIKEINDNLDGIAKAKDMFQFRTDLGSIQKFERVESTSLVDESKISGRDHEKNTLISKLCESSAEPKGLHIISIVGMGGIGKTTLAQLAYNDEQVKQHFDEKIWVCVSDPFDEFRIAKAIIEALKSPSCDSNKLEALMQTIGESIKRKRFLLVLDDVWNEKYDKWEPFYLCLKNGLSGSKILITTRKENVAQVMESTDVISIKELSEEECWSLFKKFAFFGRQISECERLEEIGRKIVGKCKGLPLAAKSIGSLLRFKKTKEEWENVLDSEMWRLDVFKEGIAAPLLLSYNDLPSMVKRCFIYCAVFPKDHQIVKDELIKLWMAQGYLDERENKEKEIIGKEYFDYLAARSFFQEFKLDYDGDIKRCKMHDVVHDFAQYLSNGDCLPIQINDTEEPSSTNISYEKVRHSTLVLAKGCSFPRSLFSDKKLFSLLIHDESFVCLLNLCDLFDRFAHLRALTIDRTFYQGTIIKLPKEVGKLIHLRYLKLVFLGIEELPETCCELYNLQTLHIERCWKLKSLPQGIGKLVSLRHLMFDNNKVDFMPSGLEKLTSLRTLSEFVVSDGGKYGSKACSLEGLKHFNHLRRGLSIRGLGNATLDEAKKAQLGKKKNLSSLILRFDTKTKEEEEEEVTMEGMNNENEETLKADIIIEALQPPQNLDELGIGWYPGKTLPKWIATVNNLKHLLLIHLCNCEHVPSLGKLPSLETLFIGNVSKLKRVGAEFLGIQSGRGSSSSVVSFPKLKTVMFGEMDEWEEWDFGITSSRGKGDTINIMPCLNSLGIVDCPKLKALPDHLLHNSTLQELFIDKCPILEERYKQEGGEDWHKISHISLHNIGDFDGIEEFPSALSRAAKRFKNWFL